MKLRILMMAGIATFGLVSSANAYTISTLADWDGFTAVGGVGAGDVTFGEVFTAPVGALTSFAFEVNDGGAQLTFVAEVYEWAGSVTGGSGPQGTVGPSLYTSAPIASSADGTYDLITMNTGGVALTAGDNYVLDLHDADYGGMGGYLGLISPYFSHPGEAFDGGFNFNIGPSDSGVWNDFVDLGSLAYSATFADPISAPGDLPVVPGGVPEPTSWTLMLLGFGAMGAAFRARRAVPVPA